MNQHEHEEEDAGREPVVEVELAVPGARETAVPPALHAVPAATQSLVHPGEVVTLGVPGSYWLLDEFMVQYGPDLTPEGETYQLMPTSGFGATRQATVTGGTGEPRFRFVQAHVDDMWLYRDSTERLSVEQVSPWRSGAWFDRVQDNLDRPPSVRHPRPARELVSLSGRRVRTMSSGGAWRWAIALSEPVMEDDAIVVAVCDPWHYHLAVYGHPPPGSRWVHKPPLHAVWAY